MAGFRLSEEEITRSDYSPKSLSWAPATYFGVDRGWICLNVKTRSKICQFAKICYHFIHFQDEGWQLIPLLAPMKEEYLNLDLILSVDCAERCNQWEWLCKGESCKFPFAGQQEAGVNAPAAMSLCWVYWQVARWDRRQPECKAFVLPMYTAETTSVV